MQVQADRIGVECGRPSCTPVDPFSRLWVINDVTLLKKPPDGFPGRVVSFSEAHAYVGVTDAERQLAQSKWPYWLSLCRCPAGLCCVFGTGNRSCYPDITESTQQVHPSVCYRSAGRFSGDDPMEVAIVVWPKIDGVRSRGGRRRPQTNASQENS